MSLFGTNYSKNIVSLLLNEVGYVCVKFILFDLDGLSSPLTLSFQAWIVHENYWLHAKCTVEIDLYFDLIQAEFISLVFDLAWVVSPHFFLKRSVVCIYKEFDTVNNIFNALVLMWSVQSDECSPLWLRVNYFIRVSNHDINVYSLILLFFFGYLLFTLFAQLLCQSILQLTLQLHLHVFLVAERIRFHQKFGQNLILLLLNIFWLFIVLILDIEGGLPLIGNANSIKWTPAILINNFANTVEAHSVIAWQLAWLFHLS